MNAILHEQPMPDDIPPVTDESIAAALAAQRQERDDAQKACGGRLRFADDDTAVLPALTAEIRRIATVHPFPASDRHQEQIDELFTAPSAIERVHILQAHESLKRDELAEDIAARVFGEPLAVLHRASQALCRYLACHVLRSSQACWTNAAEQKAQKVAAETMRTEGGSAFRNLPDEHIEALSRLLTARILTTYHGMTEGATALVPGAYLRIVNGGSK